MNRISIISDEIDTDLAVALPVCRRLGFDEVELRTIGGRTCLDVEESELTSAVARVRAEGLDVRVLATPVLKCPLPGAPGRAGAALHGAAVSATLDEHLALLDVALERAAAVEVPFVRVFSCWRTARPADVRDQVVEILREAHDRAEPYPVELLLENEHDCNVATAAETAAVLEADARFLILWDPANHVRAGGAPEEAVPDGFEDRVAHLHLKDVDAGGSWVPLGTGLVPYARVVDGLTAAGYDGAISLETHCELNGSRVAATEAALSRVRALEPVG